MKILLTFIAKPSWFNFRFKVKFYMLLLIFHCQIASVLCDETVEVSFGFQLVLFPVPAHLCWCKEEAEPREGLQRKAADTSSFRTVLGLSQSFNLRVVTFPLLDSGCIKRGLLSKLF